MSSSTRENVRFRYWKSAGIWVAVLVMALVIAGLILSYDQAQVLAVKRIEAAKPHAMYLVVRVGDEFDQAVRSLILRGLDRKRDAASADPLLADRSPLWVLAVVDWDGRRLLGLAGGDERIDRHFDAIQAALEPRRLRAMDRPAANGSPALNPPPRLIPPREEFYFDDLGPAGLLLVSMRTEVRRGEPAVVAAVVDKERLRSDLIEPMIGVESGMELATTYDTQALWYEPIGLGLRFWAIQPTAAFVRQQRAIATRQTGVHALVTLPSLAAVLLMLWFMFRLARREMALSEMKSNFVADVSHELKTPLALIRMFGETLLEGRVRSEEKREEYYTVILRESTRLSHLIDNLLDFSRIEAGRKEYRFVEGDAGDIVRETYESYRLDLDHHGFEHTLNVAPGLPRVAMDRDAVAQAMVNLIGNAMKYSDDDRFVGIDVEPDTRRGAHGVLISVHDRGIGIRPEERARVFEGFYRSADRRVRDRRGVGLGLALVRQIVESHHGAVWVEPRLVKGSTFRIFLPSAPGAGAAGTGPKAAAVVEAHDARG